MKKLILAGSVVGGLAFPALAAAGGSSTLSGYGGPAGTVAGTVQKSGTLPFTGLNLTVVLVVGLVLVGVGYFMRRRGRTSA
jgi:hypothetical protein